MSLALVIGVVVVTLAPALWVFVVGTWGLLTGHPLPPVSPAVAGGGP